MKSDADRLLGKVVSADFRPRQIDPSVHKLITAVIYRALLDTTANEIPERARNEAFLWFFEDTELEPFSIRWCCEHLDSEGDGSWLIKLLQTQARERIWIKKQEIRRQKRGLASKTDSQFSSSLRRSSLRLAK